MIRRARTGNQTHNGALATMSNLALVLLLFAAVLPVRAEQAIDVQDAWIRHMAGDRPMAGYFVMHNRGDEDRRLVGAASPAFGAIQMHEAVETDGMSSMRPVDSVPVPHGGRIEFQPGGYHLMLMQRQKNLAVDDQVPVILEFADAGSRSVTFTIKPTWQE